MNEVKAIGGVSGAVEWRAPKPSPRVGDTLQIRHQVKRTSSGEVLGIQRADGRPTNTKITAVYMDGSVRCGHSEVWEVKPGTTGHWETVNPYRGDKEVNSHG